MKTMTRILGVVAVLAVVTLVAAPSAQANCNPAKLMSTWGNGGYFYINLPAGADNTSVVGRFWQKGGRALANEGAYEDSNWLKFYAPTAKWYIEANLGDALVFGCPAGSIIVTLDTGNHSLTLEVDETPALAKHFDFSRIGTDFDFAAKPRPTVQSSSRAGDSVNLSLNLAPQTGGTYGPPGAATAAAVGFQLAIGSGPADPGTNAALYTSGGPITPGSPTPLSVNCTDQLDKWVAVQTLIDGVPGAAVGPRTRVACNPALADPKFKNIDRPARPNPRRDR